MGPLQGVKILEIAGIGPGPFAAMLLSDLGAEVIRIDRRSAAGGGSRGDAMHRGRRSLAVDLKHPEGVETLLRLTAGADALLEGFRPGVMERLGIGPDACLARNPALVYGRMTGWGQEGPLAHAAGHDINYIAISGVLGSIGRRGEAPVPPLNLVGDFGGGGMYLALGVVAAVLRARQSGEGQVVDAAMTEGSALLMTMMYAMLASGSWQDEQGTNLLDTGAHFYDTYECSDSEYIALGSIEPQFYALLREKAGLDDAAYDAQMDRSAWPALKEDIAMVIKRKTRAEWCELMEGSDVCFAPVLSLEEAPNHPHNKARGSFIELEGVVQPAPGPRFSRTPCEVQHPPAITGEHSEAVLADWGFSADEIAGLKAAGAI